MKSYELQCDLKQVAAHLVKPLLAAFVIGLLLRGGIVLGWIPAPWPILDTDRTILAHQANAACSTNSASILFVGDSSCLMDVDASQINHLLRQR